MFEPSWTRAANGRSRITKPEKPIGGSLSIKSLDLAPDGKRIAALMPASEGKGSPEVQNRVVFLENFFDELRRRVSVGK